MCNAFPSAAALDEFFEEEVCFEFVLFCELQDMQLHSANT
jgi:hypothetical protein